MKQIKYLFIMVLVVLLAGCASSKQNPYAKKRKKSSYVSATQLGRNKYFYSSGYQKKLKKSYRKR